MFKHPIVRTFFYAGYTFLYVPIILIMVYSLNAAPTLVWQGHSWRWYGELLRNQALWKAAVTSLRIALVSASASVVLGTACASLWTRPSRAHASLGMLATMPLVIPEIVMGLSLLLTFVGLDSFFGWPQRGTVTVTIAHTLVGAAYVTAIVRARLASLDPTLTEAALDLGARPYHVFFLIKFPLIVPALIASWLVAFVLSFDDVVLASFTSGPGTTTLPLMIFSSIKVGYTPQINALATLIVIFVTGLIALAGGAMYRRQKSFS
jgi:putrescine transport system permease protein